jgi:hypothetical protein
MGILRTDTISGLEKPTAVTGSVLFDGTGDYLTLNGESDFAFGTGDFTVEMWVYHSVKDVQVVYYDSRQSSGNGAYPSLYKTNTNYLAYYANSSTQITGSTEIAQNSWNHIALCRTGTSTRLFLNGIQQGATWTDTTNYINGTSRPTICADGNNPAISPSTVMNGYISNLRVLKGTALYTENFTPPTRELQPIGDTVLLCCNNPDSAGAEATGKTITVNGDAVASTFSPGLTRDFTYGTQFDGVSRFDTQGYFVPPSGTTEQQFPNFAGVDAASARGIFAGGYGSPFLTKVNNIDYIIISSTGNSSDFGDLSSAKTIPATAASPTRGVIAGGQPSPAPINTIEYVTISSTGNVADFGDLVTSKGRPAGCSNSTRGIFAGGYSPFYTTQLNSIEYVTISSTGNSFDFGDLFTGRYGLSSCSSTTRGVFAGGSFNTPTPTTINTIDYITITSTGNAQDFGDLSANRRTPSSCSNSTRGLFGGGIESPSNSDVNTIEYITIASLGNVNDFGDLTQTRRALAACSSSSRAVFGGGYIAPANLNIIDYVTISSIGNASDFGDLSRLNSFNSSFSNGHGGLG